MKISTDLYYEIKDKTGYDWLVSVEGLVFGFCSKDAAMAFIEFVKDSLITDLEHYGKRKASIDLVGRRLK